MAILIAAHTDLPAIAAAAALVQIQLLTSPVQTNQAITIGQISIYLLKLLLLLLLMLPL